MIEAAIGAATDYIQERECRDTAAVMNALSGALLARACYHLSIDLNAAPPGSRFELVRVGECEDLGGGRVRLREGVRLRRLG